MKQCYGDGKQWEIFIAEEKKEFYDPMFMNITWTYVIEKRLDWNGLAYWSGDG